MQPPGTQDTEYRVMPEAYFRVATVHAWRRGAVLVTEGSAGAYVVVCTVVLPLVLAVGWHGCMCVRGSGGCDFVYLSYFSPDISMTS